MKRFICVLLACTVLGSLAFAQKREEKDGWREKMRAEQVSFLTEQLNLTEAEAQAFWPVYNDIQKQRRESFEALQKAYVALEEGAEGKDVSTLLDNYLKAKNANNQLDAEAIDRYKSVLPAEKVAKLLVAEERFRHQQIGRLGKGGPQMGGPQGGPGNGGHRGRPSMQ